MPSRALLPFPQLSHRFRLPQKMLFHYFKLQQAARVQFPQPPILQADHFEELLAQGDLKKPLSSLYGALLCANSPKIELLLEIWKEDTPCPEKEGWKDCLEQGPKLIISSRHKLLQVKFLHRVYYTPLKSSWM